MQSFQRINYRSLVSQILCFFFSTKYPPPIPVYTHLLQGFKCICEHPIHQFFNQSFNAHFYPQHLQIAGFQPFGFCRILVLNRDTLL